MIVKVIDLLELFCEKKRKQLKAAARGSNLYHAPLSTWSDEEIVVEADGLGGAFVRTVFGNYPADYHLKSEFFYATEADAIESANLEVSKRQLQNC